MNSTVVGIQETKLKKCSYSQIGKLWGGGGDDVDFAQVEANGNSGGLITTWDKKRFHCEYVIEDVAFLTVVGKWTGVPGLVGLVNVYGPRDVRERKEAWRMIEQIVSKEEVKWCVFGDFNEVRKDDERANSITNNRGTSEFNDFIGRSKLLEVPMIGRRFTRVSDDGLKFSKLDCFLITNDFGLAWKNLGVKALERKWSDHVPIMLYEDKSDFGAKPFKFFDSWTKEEGVEELVKEAWHKEVKSLRSDCIFRDKLKKRKRSRQRMGKEEVREFCRRFDPSERRGLKVGRRGGVEWVECYGPGPLGKCEEQMVGIRRKEIGDGQTKSKIKVGYRWGRKFKALSRGY